jgi:hypothetical protein
MELAKAHKTVDKTATLRRQKGLVTGLGSRPPRLALSRDSTIVYCKVVLNLPIT